MKFEVEGICVEFDRSNCVLWLKFCLSCNLQHYDACLVYKFQLIFLVYCKFCLYNLESRLLTG